jgi:hypothetical protein
MFFDTYCPRDNTRNGENAAISTPEIYAAPYESQSGQHIVTWRDSCFSSTKDLFAKHGTYHSLKIAIVKVVLRKRGRMCLPNAIAFHIKAYTKKTPNAPNRSSYSYLQVRKWIATTYLLA